MSWTVAEPDVFNRVNRPNMLTHTHFVMSVLTFHPCSVTQITLNDPAVELLPLKKNLKPRYH